MMNYTKVTYSIDEESLALLELIAEHERAPEDNPNESKEIRRMIREKAAALGIVIPNGKKPARKGA